MKQQDSEILNQVSEALYQFCVVSRQTGNHKAACQLMKNRRSISLISSEALLTGQTLPDFLSGGS
jgi:hypothetical protein